MHKHTHMILTIAAVAVMGATLLGSTFTQAPAADSTSAGVTKQSTDLLEKIHDMGGLQLVMPKAFAETDCDALEATGRNVVEFNLTGESIEMPIMGGKTYQAMSFGQRCRAPRSG